MDKTEKIVSAIPSAAELEQLAELHKGNGRPYPNANPLASNAERILRQ